MVGGISPTGTGIAYMTLENNNRIDKENVMHEIMHGLGLYHTFDDESKHKFKDKSTKNYMDYNTNKEYTWKWQWEKIQQYLN